MFNLNLNSRHTMWNKSLSVCKEGNWYDIPHWDQVRLNQLDLEKIDHLEYLWSKDINKDYYLLSQIVVDCWNCYYELLLVNKSTSNFVYLPLLRVYL